MFCKNLWQTTRQAQPRYLGPDFTYLGREVGWLCLEVFKSATLKALYDNVTK